MTRLLSSVKLKPGVGVGFWFPGGLGDGGLGDGASGAPAGALLPPPPQAVRVATRARVASAAARRAPAKRADFGCMVIWKREVGGRFDPAGMRQAAR